MALPSLFKRNKTGHIDDPESKQEYQMPEALPAMPKMKDPGYIEVGHKDADGECRVRIMGANRKVRFISEGYYTPTNARRAARSFSKDTGLRVIDRSNG